MRVSTALPVILHGLFLIALSTTHSLATEPASNRSELEPVIHELRSWIEGERVASGTPGVQIALMVGGDIVWSEGFGWANLEGRVPATPETRFGIGSISKTLTMITCARLVDQGRLNWDAPVESYLPDFPYAGAGVTVRNIGAHLSGMSDSFADSVYETTKSYTTTEAYHEVVKAPLAHEAMEAHLYATDPFTVIAAVIETLEGTSFTDVVAREVTSPLELDDTLPNDPRVDIPRRARFYHPEGDTLIIDESNTSCRMAGAGYLSSAVDLVTLGHAALMSDYLTTERRDDLITDMKTSDGAWTFFGLGWHLGRSDEWGFFYGNSGGGRGVASTILVIPDHDVVVAVCTNLTDGPSWRMAKVTAERIVEASR